MTFGKVGVVFVAVVYAMKKKVPMGLALSGGGLAIALLMSRTPAWIVHQLAGDLDATLFNTGTGRFVAVMGMIVALSYVLQRAGQIERLTSSFRVLFRNPRVTLATLPAIIGLLPMPGGALFSAPMVEASASGTGLDKEDKALVNYWYRHVWEYSWPLYPGVMFTAQLAGVEVRRISMAQAPLCIAAFLAGFIILARAVPVPSPATGMPRRQAVFEAFVSLLPFLIVFALYLVAGLNLLLSVSIGLAFACLFTVATRRIGFGALLKSLFANWGTLDMMLMGYGAKIFGDLMIQSGAIAGISSMFQSMGLPVAVLAVMLPGVVGFFAGMTIVFVMTTFPVILAYPGIMANPIPILCLAYAAGYCGTILSPVHSCLVMSVRYFKSDLFVPIRRMLAPCAIILLTGVGLMLLWSRVKI